MYKRVYFIEILYRSVENNLISIFYSKDDCSSNQQVPQQNCKSAARTKSDEQSMFICLFCISFLSIVCTTPYMISYLLQFFIQNSFNFAIFQNIAFVFLILLHDSQFFIYLFYIKMFQNVFISFWRKSSSILSFKTLT